MIATAELANAVCVVHAGVNELRDWVRANASHTVADALIQDIEPLVPSRTTARVPETIPELINLIGSDLDRVPDPKLPTVRVPFDVASSVVTRLDTLGNSMRVDVYLNTESEELRLAVANWIATAFTQVIRPLIAQHRALAPPGFFDRSAIKT